MSKITLVERTILGLHNSLIPEIPKPNTNASVLDIGCGTGAWLDKLGTIGFKNLHGIDIDTQQFKTERATVSRVNLDSDNLHFDSQFDLITAIEIIEHLENPGRIFSFVEKNLKPDGYFLLTTPNIHSLSCRLKFLVCGELASFDEKGDRTHIYPVLLQSLARILPRYSLEIVKQWAYPDRGSIIYRQSTQFISNLLELLLPNQTPGDTLCLLIQKTK